MASERFVAIQTAIQATPETPTWERWTIDEVDEGVVRVLVCWALFPEELRTFSEALLTPHGFARSPTATREELHRQAMVVELDKSEARWSREQSMFVTEPLLAAFLRDRTGKPGLPSTRPLREGDVFWILIPSAGETRSEFGGTPRLEAGASRVAQYRARGADVWDVTAAARQVAKHDYHRVVRAAGDEMATSRDGRVDPSGSANSDDHTLGEAERADQPGGNFSPESRRKVMDALHGWIVDVDHEPLFDSDAESQDGDSEDDDSATESDSDRPDSPFQAHDG